MVQLNDELLGLLDAEAASQGTSRSDLIRRAVTEYLAEAGRDSVTRRIVEGYRRIPPATPDGWADLDRLTDRATHETLQRLDAEEREAGAPPW